jgi:hypothetical protein
MVQNLLSVYEARFGVGDVDTQLVVMILNMVSKT